MSGALTLYRAGMTILSPILPIYLKRRVKAGKEDAARIGERLGRSNIARPAGPLVWMHAASVGESVMLLALINDMRARRPDITILLTTGTLTSARLMAKRLPDGCIHQFAPADTRKAVRAFLDHWKPDFGIWAESELWPNLILETRTRGIPTALVNARMSADSLEGWSKRKSFARELLSGFDPLLAADAATADGMSQILERDISVAGNLKYAAPALSVAPSQKTKLRNAIGAREVWAAVSTHHGEDIWVARAHKEVQAAKPGSLLILAPRHPERGNVIATALHNQGLKIARRSAGDVIAPDTDVYLFDTLGELGLVFAVSAVSVVCGSLVPGLAGHNPLEPARLRSAVLSGTNISSFADIYADLDAAGGVRFITDAPSFSRQVLTLLDDDTARKAQIKAARALAKSQDGVLSLVRDALAPHLPAPHMHGTQKADMS